MCPQVSHLSTYYILTATWSTAIAVKLYLWSWIVQTSVEIPPAATCRAVPTVAGSPMPTQPLSHSQFSAGWEGENEMRKLMGWEKTGKSSFTITGGADSTQEKLISFIAN